MKKVIDRIGRSKDNTSYMVHFEQTGWWYHWFIGYSKKDLVNHLRKSGYVVRECAYR